MYNFRDLGVHLDGFISMIAHTVVVGANADNKITDKKANCFLAAHYASQAALRLMRPGNDVSISWCYILLIKKYNSTFDNLMKYECIF